MNTVTHAILTRLLGGSIKRVEWCMDWYTAGSREKNATVLPVYPALSRSTPSPQASLG